MDEYEASCKRVEKISIAIQSIKESLTCRICLELFDEPVTIKCGHKFCRDCILRVTNNENSSCPFCNTKIQKRSIPKDGNAILQASVKHFETLIKAIQADSGIDVSQPYNKAKNTKESSVDYSKPSTSKFENTPSTSKGSPSIFNQKSAKPKVTHSVKSRLSLTKKKSDIKSPSQNSGNNTLHKYYLPNKSDPVPVQVVHSQEKVQSWLDKCTPGDNDNIVEDSIPGTSKPSKDIFVPDQIATPPDQIFSSPQNNELKESDPSPVASSDKSSDSKFKETQLRIQEAEKMARERKRKMSLNVKENNNVKTPSSAPVTSESDAYNWHRVKKVGREMQVKTFKTLNVSIERYSPTVAAVDDTVIYNSTNNDSKNVSHGSEGNNTSTDKTPLQTKKCNPLKSENNNLPKTSPRIVIEDYKHRSMDSTASPKQECVTALDVDQNQLNEIIGVVPSTSTSKTPEKAKTSLKRLKGSNLSSKLNKLSPSKRKSIEQELSNDESSKSDSRTLHNLQNSPSKKNILSLKNLKSTTRSTSSSPASILDQTNQKENESSNNFSKEKSNSKLLHEKTNSTGQKIASTNCYLPDNLANKRSSSVSSGCRVIFQKLGKICKKSKNVPFRYLGKLEKEKCLFFNSNSYKKPAIVVKSVIPVCIDYKSRLDDKNVANLDDFESDESHSKSILPKNDVSLQSTTEFPTVHKYEEAMNIDEDINVQRPGQPDQHMEIDEALLPAKMIVKNSSNLEKRSFEDQRKVDRGEDSSSKSSRTKRKSLENEDFEIISPQIDENVPEPFGNTDEGSKHFEPEVEKWDVIPESSSRSTKIRSYEFDPLESSSKSPKMQTSEFDPPDSSSKVDTVKNSSNVQQNKSRAKKILEKTGVIRIPDDLISISSDDSESKVHRTNSIQKVGKAKFNESVRKSDQKVTIKSDLESCTESEVSVTPGKRDGNNVEDAKHGYSSTSSSSLRTTGKKKRTHSESSNDDNDVVDIIDKWTKKAKTSSDAGKEKTTKKLKITVDSEEMINRNASKVRHRSRHSFSSSSGDEETFKENKHQQDSLINEPLTKVKTQSTEVHVNKLTAMPSSMLSADLFETNEQSIEPMQSLQKQVSENSMKVTLTTDFDAQSDKENISDRSPDNITVIDTRQLKRRKSATSRNVENDNKENNECNRTSDPNKSIKSTQETADEIESSQKKRKSIVSKSSDNNDKEINEQKRVPDFNKSAKTAEDRADEIESSRNDKNKTADNFEHESDPYFIRDSLLNVTQDQIACKNIEKDLFGVDLSKIHENENKELLDSDKFSTPRRKLTNSEENDDFDSDNIAPTPMVRRRPTFRFPSSQSSPGSEGNAADMSSPAKNTAWIPAITPMKNTKSYPLCHSTPMMNTPENHVHSQIENIKLVCSSLSPENMKLVHKFIDRFDAQFQSNFDMDVTHVIVKVDPQTKAGPKTFKYIQGIAFQKYVVSFEWITDCLAKNKLLDPNDEKYDVLDPDIFESGCKKSRLSSHKLFKNFAFCCMEPFEKVSLSEFEELLTYNGAVIISSLSEFHLYNNKLKIIIVGTEDLNDKDIALLTKAEAAAVHFEWIVDSLSQFQILSLPSYLFETTVEKAKSLGFPPELLVEEETLEEDDDDN